MIKSEVEKFDESIIRDRIFSARGFQVMLDRDLAELYGVETKVLNQAVKRNKDRFPEKFCFLLNNREMQNLKSQFVTSSWGGKRKNSTAFTELGVAMLAGVLKSETAVKISIMIIEAFVAMRKFIQANGQIFQRLDRVELKQIETDKKIDQVFEIMESKNSVPDQGIFFEGQVFDAYKFVSDIFRRAENAIVIVDNYVDDTVLFHLTKIKKGVHVRIVTKSISDQFRLDLKKFQEQYFTIEVKETKDIHDRFIIIDGDIVYHFGASLKDLGRKLFGFTKMDKSGFRLMEKIK